MKHLNTIVENTIHEVAEGTEDTITNNNKGPPTTAASESEQPGPIPDVESFYDDTMADSCYDVDVVSEGLTVPTKRSSGSLVVSDSDPLENLTVSIHSDPLEKSFRMSIGSDNRDTVETVEKSVWVSIDGNTLKNMDGYNSDDDDDTDPNMRRATLCCFSCCDLVRACIIINSIAVVMWVIVFSLVIYNVKFIMPFLGVRESDDENDDYNDDDGYLNSYKADDYFHNEISVPFTKPNPRPYLIMLIRIGCNIFFSAIGVYGASKFHQPTVLCTAIWCCVYSCWAALDRTYSGPAAGILLAYPNWHLLFELRRGTISRELYWREKFCCLDEIETIDE